MRAPDFWRRNGILPRLLSPLAAVYDGIGRVRRRLVTPTSVGLSVVCVGNLVAGGAGKTPVALTVAGRLQARGHRVHFLTRGYGGRIAGPVQVDPEKHATTDVGDEPLLLARQAPTWVARDRVAGAAAARDAGAEIVVMDDGFQNPHLAKDLSILVVDAAYGLGNGRVHPAGPLREDAVRGLARAGAVVMLEGPEPPAPLPFGLDWPPRLAARLVPSPEAQRLAGRRVLAFAGIGRPQRFFATLQDMGAVVVGAQSFADHHPYRPEEIMALVEEANALDAVPVTTAKDSVRLPAEARAMVEAVDVTLEFAAPDRLDALLDRVVARPAVRQATDG